MVKFLFMMFNNKLGFIWLIIILLDFITIIAIEHFLNKKYHFLRWDIIFFTLIVGDGIGLQKGKIA